MVCSNFGQIIICSSTSTRADKVSGESVQFVPAIHDEGDRLTLCEYTHKVMTALIVMLPSECSFGDISAIS
jgi:hypothetical protein